MTNEIVVQTNSGVVTDVDQFTTGLTKYLGGLGLPNQNVLVPVDEPEVSRVDEDAEALAGDEDGVADAHGVAQEDESATQAQIPERGWDDALPAAFGSDPLDEKAGTEEGLPSEADGYPDVLGREE